MTGPIISPLRCHGRFLRGTPYPFQVSKATLGRQALPGFIRRRSDPLLPRWLQAARPKTLLG